MAFQTVFYTRGRVQFAVDRIHGSESAASHGLVEHGCALNRFNGHFGHIQLALVCGFRDGEHNG